MEVHTLQMPLWTHVTDRLGAYYCSRCGRLKSAMRSGMYLVLTIRNNRVVPPDSGEPEFLCGMCNALDSQGTRRKG